MRFPDPNRRLLYLGVAIVTGSTLLLELVFTRIFSVIMYYHFAFLAISLALFGLGTAGVYVYLRPSVAAGHRLGSALALHAFLAAASTVFALWVVLEQRVSLTTAGDNIRALAAIYLAVALPFFFSGLCVTLVINRFAADMGRLYFWDLTGAALGCVALALVLGKLGGVGTVLVCAVLFASAGVLFAVGGRVSTDGSRPSSAPLCVGTFGLVVIVGAAVLQEVRPFLEIPSVKGTREERVTFAKWNSFSRVTVEELETDFYWLKMDSSAATRIFSGEVARKGFEPTRRFTETRVASLVYALDHPGPALIIGPGGGADVIGALYMGKKDITGVELNPIIVHDVMLGDFKDYSGALYERPEVRMVVGEGRNFVRSSTSRYASIQATLVDTWAATSAGALTLSENTLYTREAFDEYLAHLLPDGTLTMTRWLTQPPREFLRLLVLGRAALDDLGVRHHARHFYVAGDARLGTFLLKRSPLTRAEVERLDAYVDSAGLRRIYTPDDPSLDNPHARFLRLENWEDFVAGYQADITPPTDNRPFFFYTVRPDKLLSLLGHSPSSTDPNLGLMLLVVLLFLVLALVLVFLVVPLFLFRRDVLRGDRWGKVRYLGYFVALGCGFIVIEISLMQKFILFLGHPTYALVVVLFSVLIFSGIGSLWVRHVQRARAARRIGIHLVLLTALVVTYSAALSPLFDALATLPLAVRIGLAVAAIAPLGLLLGTFLPVGIQAAGERFSVVVPWAWGMNGAASVFGSVLAVALAMNLGFDLAIYVALLFYVGGYALVRGVLRAERPSAA